MRPYAAVRMDARSASPRTRIRPVVPEDVPALCNFLHTGFADSGIPAEDWRALFDYPWRPEGYSPGFVLMVDNVITGFIGAIYARRELPSGSTITCNCSSWYVRPEHRTLAVALLAAAHREPALCYTNFTPNTTSERMLRRMGFRPLVSERLILPPLWHVETLAAHRPRILFAPEAVRARLDAAQRRIYDDHAGYGCLQAVVVEGEARAFIVAKRQLTLLSRRARWLIRCERVPTSLLLHCSDRALLARHLERIKLALLTRQRTLALVADAHYFARRPRALVRKDHALYRGEGIVPEALDRLYSEQVLLPV